MGSQPKLGPGGVSKRMIAVIIAMLLIIIVPAAVMSAPWSKVVITVTNTDSVHSVEGHYTVYGSIIGYNSFDLAPGEDRVWTYSLSAGRYSIHVSYLYQGDYAYYDYFSTSFSVPFLGTEEVQIDLDYSQW